MRQLKPVILVCCAALAVLLPRKAWAAGSDTLSLRIAFPKGVWAVERDFGGNAENIDAFLSCVNCLNGDPDLIVRSVLITTAASPEGSFKANEKLSVRRARSIMDCLLEGTSLKPSQISVRSCGENWAGLLDMILRSDGPWAEQALMTIATSGVLSSPDAQKSAACKRDLRRIRDGEFWTWMEETALAQLRCADGLVSVITCSPEEQRQRDTLVVMHEQTFIHRDTVWHLSAPQEPAAKGFRRDSLFRTPVMGIRSNLLAPLMNIGVEVPISNRFSIGADWYCPWAQRAWINHFLPSQMYCLQLMTASMEARWWLGKEHSSDAPTKYRLRGHSLGLSLSGGYYDLEYNGKGQQGEFISTGVDYLYSLPLGKGGAHFELSIGAGITWNPYRNYSVLTEGGYLTADGERCSRLIPVPKAGISLCIPITSKEDLR